MRKIKCKHIIKNAACFHTWRLNKLRQAGNGIPLVLVWSQKGALQRKTILPSFLMQFSDMTWTGKDQNHEFWGFILSHAWQQHRSSVRWTPRTTDAACPSHEPHHGSFLEIWSFLELSHFACLELVKDLIWRLRSSAKHNSFYSLITLLSQTSGAYIPLLTHPMAMFSNKILFMSSIQLELATSSKYFCSNLLSKELVLILYLTISTSV